LHRIKKKSNAKPWGSPKIRNSSPEKRGVGGGEDPLSYSESKGTEKKVTEGSAANSSSTGSFMGGGGTLRSWGEKPKTTKRSMRAENGLFAKNNAQNREKEVGTAARRFSTFNQSKTMGTCQKKGKKGEKGKDICSARCPNLRRL